MQIDFPCKKNISFLKKPLSTVEIPEPFKLHSHKQPITAEDCATGKVSKVLDSYIKEDVEIIKQDPYNTFLRPYYLRIHKVTAELSEKGSTAHKPIVVVEKRSADIDQSEEARKRRRISTEN
jgi:hypothetical protein